MALMSRSPISLNAITPEAGAQVYFRETSSPISAEVTVYDAGGTPLVQPITADGDGLFEVFGADGETWVHYAAQTPVRVDLMSSGGLRYDIKFDTAANFTGDPIQPGEMRWNATDKTVDMCVNGAVLQIGQEFFVRAAATENIGNGYPVSIPVTGSSSGTRARIELADPTQGGSCRCFIGITTEAIDTGDEGFVTRLGFVREIDTTGAPFGEIWSEGDRIWVSITGGLTNVEPTAGNKLLVGMVITKNASHGIILSNPRHFELTQTYYKAGIHSRTESTISFNDSAPNARTFTITPTGTHYWVYLGSDPIGKTAESVQITDTVGTHFIYFDATTKALTASTSVWDLNGLSAPVATVYWDGTHGWIGEERHAPRDAAERALHAMLHTTVGARYGTGLTGTFTNTTLSITTGTIYDEDIPNTLSGTATTCRLIYRNASNQMIDTPSCSTPYAVSAGALQFDSAGTLTAVPVGNYVVNWCYMTNDPAQPIYIQVGQATYTTVSAARAAAQILPSNISTREWRPLYQLIYRNVGGTPTYVEANDLRATSTLSGGVVSSLAASSIVTSATEHFTSTNQQAMDSEIDRAVYGEHLPLRLNTTALHGDSATFTCASTRYVPDVNGVLRSASANQPAVMWGTYVSDGVWTESATANGMLLEPTTTNQILRSAEFGTTWTTLNMASVSSNVTTAPDGTATADGIVENNSADVAHYIQQTVPSGITDNTRYVASVFAKAGARGWVQFILVGKDNVTHAAYINLSTGAVGTLTSTTLADILVIPYGSGWYRIAVAANVATGVTSTAIRIYPAEADNDRVYTGDNATVGIYLWGAQLEARPYGFQSTYIPTTTVGVARSATNLSIPSTTLGKNLKFKFRSTELSGRSTTLIYADANNRVYHDGTSLYLVAGGTSISGVWAFRRDQTYIVDVITDGRLELQVDGKIIASSRAYTAGIAWTSTVYLGSDSTPANNVSGYITELGSVKTGVNVDRTMQSVKAFAQPLLANASATKTGAYTLTTADMGTIVRCDTTSGGFSVTLEIGTTENLPADFTCVIWNVAAANNITLAAGTKASDGTANTLTSSSTTLGPKKAVTVWKAADGSWYAAGGV